MTEKKQQDNFSDLDFLTAPVSQKSRSIRNISSQSSLQDWLEDNWKICTGIIVLGGCVFLSYPSIITSQNRTEIIRNQLQGKIADIEFQRAESDLQRQRNGIAEARYADPNTVPVRAIRSGETVYRLDGQVASAGVIAADCQGFTAQIEGHPTKEIDLVTGAIIMRPIASKVYASRGEAYQKFRDQWCKNVPFPQSTIDAGTPGIVPQNVGD